MPAIVGSAAFVRGRMGRTGEAACPDDPRTMPRRPDHHACILLTGATGYIASHTWLALAAAGLRRRRRRQLRQQLARGAAPAGRARRRRAPLRRGRRDRPGRARRRLRRASRSTPSSTSRRLRPSARASPGRSPTTATTSAASSTLAEAMQAPRLRKLVFSSSATVYGQPETLPITEDAPLAATSPYGATKLIGEEHPARLRALPTRPGARRCCATSTRWARTRAATIGEDPRGTPNNLMPYVAQVAVGKRAALQVFGGDYDTPDGTGVRDYIHVDGPGRRPRGGAAPPAGARRFGHRQPRHRPGYSVLEVVERSSGPAAGRCPTRSWRAGRATSPPATPTRRCAERAARLEGDARPRRHVRRHLALAIGQSGRLRGALIARSGQVPVVPVSCDVRSAAAIRAGAAACTGRRGPAPGNARPRHRAGRRCGKTG